MARVELDAANYLILESLQKFQHYYCDDFRGECLTCSGQFLSLNEIHGELLRRLIRIFLRDDESRRPGYGEQQVFQSNPDWRDFLQFHEYFYGDTGAGIGASHQTGWTALVAKMIQQSGGQDTSPPLKGSSSSTRPIGPSRSAWPALLASEPDNPFGSLDG